MNQETQEPKTDELKNQRTAKPKKQSTNELKTD